jgi:hypothetical protein
MNECEPTLYIIMRTDLPDMNPGKGMAQASHATDDFNAWKALMIANPHTYGGLISEFERWQEHRSFGRVIVLQGTLEEMNAVVCSNDFCGLTVDDTYPWCNFYGELFLSEETTAAWCFICDETLPSEALTSLPLQV